jgi:signal transduction histidine kinase
MRQVPTTVSNMQIEDTAKTAHARAVPLEEKANRVSNASSLNSNQPQDDAPPPLQHKLVTQNKVIAVLAAGFGLATLLLLAAGFMGIRGIRLIRDTTDRLVHEQLVTTELVDEIQRQQAALSAVFYKMSGDPDDLDREKVLNQVNEVEARFRTILSLTPDFSEQAMWRELARASAAFSAEVRRLLSSDEDVVLPSKELLRRHEEVISVVARMIQASHDKSGAARQEIDRQSETLIRNSAMLLGACLLLALACAGLTVWLTARLFRQMARQSSELTRVSWQLLETQEMAARRFSHELHDELGQSLTALNASIAAHGTRPCADKAWIEDCQQLLSDSIRNVRELSQLLHPTILDDLGLDAALRWLGERFSQHTGIEVRYGSSYQERFPEEVEGHLFRIAQEALTNVARHSGARAVRIRLGVRDDKVRMLIEDDGRGFGMEHHGKHRGLGLIGIRARAQSMGGEVEIRSTEGKGVRIEVSVRQKAARHEAKDPSLVG